MIDPKELRIGNYVWANGPIMEVKSINEYEVGLYLHGSESDNWEEDIENLHPIPLTPEILQRLGAIKSSIDNSFFSHYDFDLGRDRHISVSNPGSPNEFVMLLEYNKDDGKITPSVICLRNYDYDGNTYVHHLQNIYYDLSKGEELKLQTPQLAGL